jgi:hypothetical protein
MDRGAFAQEFRVDAQAEFLAGLLARIFLQDRDHDFAHGSRQHGAAHDDYRRARMGGDGLADLLAHALHIGEVDAAVGQARRADAHQREVGMAHRVADLGAGAQPSGRYLLVNDVADVLLDDRRLAGVDQIDLGTLRIHADHFVAVFRKASRGYGANVSEPQHANFHVARMRDFS